jgi:hypothetical protein
LEVLAVVVMAEMEHKMVQPEPITLAVVVVVVVNFS